MAFEKDGVSHVNEQELQAMLDAAKPGTFFVDVRRLEEYVEGHIPGVPLVPMDTIANQVKTMDQDAEYVFICRGGGRSLKVAKYMQQHGFDRVHNYDGGMRGWNGEMTTGEEHVPQTADPKSLQRKT